MGERTALLQEHLGKVAQAQLVAYAPEDDHKDDIRRKLKVIEERAGAFVELAPACGTTKDTIAEVGPLPSFSRGSDGSVWADHLVLPGKLDSESPRIPDKLMCISAETTF